MNNNKSSNSGGTFLGRLWVFLLFAAGIVAQILLLCLQENKQIEQINLIITIIFFAIILVIFCIIFHCIGKGIAFRNDMENAIDCIESLHKANPSDVLNELFNHRLFATRSLAKAFAAYREDAMRMAEINPEIKIDIENYINQDILDNEISMHFLNQIPGAMTGLGILGTFVGLSVGLNSFNFVEAETNMLSELQPLMDGIKIAFHTSIIGLIYSLGFNFLFRRQLSKERASIDAFLDAFRRYVVPVTEDGSTGTFIKYQQSIVELLREQSKNQQYQQKMMIPELQKMTRAVTTYTQETSANQEAELERIVNQFIARMNLSLGRSFSNLQEAIDATSNGQKQITRELQASMEEIARLTYDLKEVNQTMEQSVKQVSAYLELVNAVQASAQSNLESLNAQTDYNNKILASERVLLTTITESTGRTSKAMTEFLNKASSQTTGKR